MHDEDILDDCIGSFCITGMDMEYMEHIYLAEMEPFCNLLHTITHITSISLSLHIL